MKIKTLWERKVFILFIVVLVVLLPYAATLPPQMLSKCLLTSIGIDRTDEGFEISGEMIVNKFSQSGDKTMMLVNGKGSSVSDAVNKIAQNQGKSISLAHCTLMVLGKGLETENIESILTWFLHKTEVNNNCMLIYTSDTAKDLIETGLQGEENKQVSKLEQLVKFNQENILGKPTNLETFYKDTKRTGGISLISIVKLEKEKPEEGSSGESGGGGGSSGGSGESGGGSSGEKPKGELANATETAIFKDGKYVKTLTEEQTEALKYLSSGSCKLSIKVGDAVININSKRTNIKTRMIGGTPTVFVTCKLKAEIEDITGNTDLHGPTDTLERNLQDKITSDLMSVLSEIPNSNLDFLHLYDMFYGTQTRKFKKYISTKTTEQFLSELVFDVKVEARVI